MPTLATLNASAFCGLAYRAASAVDPDTDSSWVGVTDPGDGTRPKPNSFRTILNDLIATTFSPGDRVDVIPGPLELVSANMFTVTLDTTPTILGPISVTVAGGESTNRQPTYTGTNLVYSVSGPSWLTVLPTNGRLTAAPPAGTPAGVYVATYTASNAAGSASDTLTVTVEEAPAFTAPTITGGLTDTIERGGEIWRWHAFVASDDLVVVDEGDGVNLEYLIVGGGGSGGVVATSSATACGGGGAGGVLKYVAGEAGNTGSAPLTLTVGTYPVVVGLGGAAPTGVSEGNNGGDSSFASLTAVGGGGGGAGGLDGLSGGSGGGGGVYSIPGTTVPASGGAGTASQGNAGGDGVGPPDFRAGGGGGAGAAGSDGLSGGHGGDGVQTFIRNLLGEWFGGGGGGGVNDRGESAKPLSNGGQGGGGAGGSQYADPTAGADNTGGGGGGDAGDSQVAAPGGDGIVIVAYPISSVN